MKLYKVDQIFSKKKKKRLQNDDDQDFDTRWDQALLSASETPAEMGLEGLYKSELQDSVQPQTVLAMYGTEGYSKQRTAHLFQTWKHQ